MNCKTFLYSIILVFVISSGACFAKEGSVLFEKNLEYYGKGVIDYSLPLAINTGYDSPRVGYWISNFDKTPEGNPFIVLEVILYGADYRSARHANTVILENGESCRVFFHLEEIQPKMKNLPQYCYVQVMEINPSNKYVKLRHWISSDPNSIK